MQQQLAPLTYIMPGVPTPPKLGQTGEATMNAPMDNGRQQTDLGNGLREVNARIDTMHRESLERMDLLRQEVSASLREQAREVTARIERLEDNSLELHRETNARIDTMYRELNVRLEVLNRDSSARLDASNRDVSGKLDALNREVTARIELLRKEMLDNFRLVDAKIDHLRGDMHTQFRWLVGMLLSSILGIAGILHKLL